MNAYKLPEWKHLRDKVRPEIKKFARKLRKNQTRHENLLWSRLRGRRLSGLRFRRQHIVRGYIVDFYCPEHRLAIELDGKGHDKKRDAIRDKRIFEKCRINVLRFSNLDVENKISQVVESIRITCGIGTFPINPQAQQQQQSKNDIPYCCDDERGGNVKNECRSQKEEDLALAKLCAKKVNTVDFGVRPLGGCLRQVFASVDVAERTARALSKFGVSGVPEKCSRCGLIHLKERRI